MRQHQLYSPFRKYIRNASQHKRFNDDLKHPNFGEIKESRQGAEIEICRMWSGTLIATVRFSDSINRRIDQLNLDDTECEKLNHIIWMTDILNWPTHTGKKNPITFLCEKTYLSFDCNHAKDYNPDFGELPGQIGKNIYRDSRTILEMLYRLIDAVHEVILKLELTGPVAGARPIVEDQEIEEVN